MQSDSARDLRDSGVIVRPVQRDDIRDAAGVADVLNSVILEGGHTALTGHWTPETEQAFLKGLADTLANPDEAYELCKAHVENLAGMDPADEAVQKEVLALSLDYWRADVLGYCQQSSWENMQVLLLDMGLITEPLNLDEAFTNQFVE